VPVRDSVRKDTRLTAPLIGTAPYRRHGHTTVSREKSEGALQQAAVTETGA
jgi:hypothetical protein